MRWRRLGHIFVASGHSAWMHTHAMIPVAERLDGDMFRIYFSPRDRANRGHGAYLDIDMRYPLKVQYLHLRPVLEPGELGAFDDSGALPNCIVTAGKKKRVYYTGVNLGVTVPLRNAIGVAEWNDDKHRFERMLPGAILDRTHDYPHFVATPEVHLDSDLYRMWFIACQRWVQSGGAPKHFYNIGYAESADGIGWQRSSIPAIDFADQIEYAIGAPRVLREEKLWRMWFCSRASIDAPSYRIRYAESEDGITWERPDNGLGLDVAADGWDSEMVCYPFVFDHAGERYLLYNGNGYGRSGFGIAIMEG